VMLFGRETIYWCSDRGKASDSGGGLAGCLLVTHFPLEAPFRSRWGGFGQIALPDRKCMPIIDSCIFFAFRGIEGLIPTGYNLIPPKNKRE